MYIAHLPAWYISKAAVKTWPVFGAIIKWANVLFIDRTIRRDVARMGRLMEERLDRGCGLVFFPEGTSSPGKEVWAFKPSLLQVAAEREFPVHYGAIRYEIPENTPPAHMTICWWGDMDFAPHFLNLLKLKTFSVEIKFAKKPIVEKDRKVLAATLHQSVSEIFQPVA